MSKVTLLVAPLHAPPLRFRRQMHRLQRLLPSFHGTMLGRDLPETLLQEYRTILAIGCAYCTGFRPIMYRFKSRVSWCTTAADSPT
mmetsp:Transcript_74247/g.123934  ORF Transcript_74247/g.123934 Transcript_74247/m.123934 type:complete len:86 (+) Transcript_74247:713-970(+)